MNFVLWILLGALLGRYASTLMGMHEKRAIIRNVVVGIGGVILTGWILATLIGSPAFARGEFNISSILISLMGATILLAAVQLLRNRFLNARTRRPIADDTSEGGRKQNRHVEVIIANHPSAVAST